MTPEFDAEDVTKRVMSNNQNHCVVLLNINHFSGSFLQYVKVALSVAVIRSKPSGMTGRQYAEQLFLQSHRLQQHWRTRSAELEREVLQLKQQLVQKQVSAQRAASVYETGQGMSFSYTVVSHSCF